MGSVVYWWLGISATLAISWDCSGKKQGERSAIVEKSVRSAIDEERVIDGSLPASSLGLEHGATVVDHHGRDLASLWPATTRLKLGIPWPITCCPIYVPPWASGRIKEMSKGLRKCFSCDDKHIQSILRVSSWNVRKPDHNIPTFLLWGRRQVGPGNGNKGNRHCCSAWNQTSWSGYIAEKAVIYLPG